MDGELATKPFYLTGKTHDSTCVSLEETTKFLEYVLWKWVFLLLHVGFGIQTFAKVKVFHHL